MEALDRERRPLIQAVEERKAARNAGSQEVARRKRAGEPADDLIAQGRALGEEIARLERELGEAEGRLAAILLELPNITLADVPAGGEDAQRRRARAGADRATRQASGRTGRSAPRSACSTSSAPRRSAARASSCSGGQGARLVRALMNFFLDVHAREHGYEEVWPPCS